MTEKTREAWTLGAVRTAAKGAINNDDLAQLVTASTRGLAGEDMFRVRAYSMSCIEQIVLRHLL